MKINRRRFLKTSAGSVAALPVLSLFASTPWRFLSAAEAELMDALCEQIIPGDQDPGAHDAWVVRFIDKQLTGKYQRHREEYRNGFVGVNQTSMAMFGRPFVELTFDNQTEVMRALESGKAAGEAWKKYSSSSFFNLLRSHTMQGYYGNPRHGGNREYASYRMLGLDYPQIIGQNRYR